jgi:hypothetical protein
MARVSLESLVPGLRLNRPVFNLHGALLLKTCEVLTEKHLEILKTWGVREVDVAQADGADPRSAPGPAVPPEILETVRAEAAHRFRRANPAENPVMAEVLRIVTERQALRSRQGVTQGEALRPGSGQAQGEALRPAQGEAHSKATGRPPGRGDQPFPEQV